MSKTLNAIKSDADHTPCVVIGGMKPHSSTDDDLSPTLTQNMEETKYVPIVCDGGAYGVSETDK